MADSSAAPKTEPETEHPPPQHNAVSRSAAAQLVSGAINAAKASALEDDDLAASLRICTLDGVAADDDADGLLARLAALSVSAALFVTVDGVETRIDSEDALFAALRAAAQSSQPPAFRTECRSCSGMSFMCAGGSSVGFPGHLRFTAPPRPSVLTT